MGAAPMFNILQLMYSLHHTISHIYNLSRICTNLAMSCSIHPATQAKQATRTHNPAH